MTVDFHCHSTASDGTLRPAELAERGRGFAALALTDHDTCDGLAEFLDAGRRADRPDAVRAVAGIELSIDPGAGFDTFHLLGLGIDPHNAGLQSFLRRTLEARNARNARIIANFRRLGFEMERPAGEGDPDIHAYANGKVLARPHFARWLVRHGAVKSVTEAFERYLLPDSPRETRCYEERWRAPQEEVFRTVRGAGGVCVMAHPKYWRRAWKTEGCDFAAAERGLAELKEKGLDGLEALYQANTPEEDVAFTRLAMKLGLLPSAGSDFHGDAKPTISLGMDVADTFIAPLLERLT